MSRANATTTTTTTATTDDSMMLDYSDFPESIEEAGALLGATITRCGREHTPLSAPPAGMHSSFATVFPAVPSAELLTRLYTLRAFLRSHPSDKPLASAPSLLAVLMKLLGVSTSIANRVAAGHRDDSSQRCSVDIAPMLSTPLRKLWVDCVALCHSLGSNTSTGPAAAAAIKTIKMDTTVFIRQMADLAGTHPRSARAAGGVRIAALDVMTSLFLDPKLQSQLAPWSLEVLQLCLRALRSAGNGEPTYRASAMHTACATAIACRQAYLKNRKASLLLQGAMEDKAILESVRVMKQAATDKFPEVRSAAAQLAALLAPLLVHLPSSPDQLVPTSSLDDVLSLALKNIDDESPYVADGWAEAVARCVSTAIEYNEQAKAGSRAGRRDAEEGGGPSSGSGGGSINTGGSEGPELVRFGSRKSLAQMCTSVDRALTCLVDVFVKAGGELSASRAGGTYSTGGRAVRVGLSLALTKLLQLQSVLRAIGDVDASISIKGALSRILLMLGNDMEKQLKAPISTGTSTSPTTNLFGGSIGGSRQRSKSDPSLVRLAASRVIRQGLSEMASEPLQLSTLHDIVNMLHVQQKAAASTASSSSPPHPNATTTQAASTAVPNNNQMQVLLIELSHLVSTLGEAAASAVEELVPCLQFFLSDKDHGVRDEAAIACAAVAASFPSDAGHTILSSCLEEIQMHHSELVGLASVEQEKTKSEEQSGAGGGLRMFRRLGKEQSPLDASLPHQYAIHGRALVVSILIKEMPRYPGGVPVELLTTALSVAEILVSFQFNEALTACNPGAVCLCVRAGFNIISGVLATGPNHGVASDIALIFRAWQKACSSVKSGSRSKNFIARHDLFCLDSVLSSIVVFLKYCSELLLSVPEALSQVTMLLEETLQVFMPKGRFSTLTMTPPVAARMESAVASLLEAFAWLPSGSFPMAADEVFNLSALYIRSAVESEVTCSILDTLVNKEDSLLDAKTAARAKREGQVGGARDLEETILLLTSEAALHGEREAVIHLRSWEDPDALDVEGRRFLGSTILGVYAMAGEKVPPPTPLHSVGSWRRPFDPSCASKVRLVDAAIQAFSATFGLKSGKEQQAAMDMLEALVPPLLAQLARTLGVNAALMEQDRRPKSKEDSAAVANITAVLLSCLQAIPQDDSTHNIPIGLGPQWMNKAKDLLLTLLPSASTVVRRAAAEGLGLLATLGVIEDSHFMQSTVLHSLDEVMQGNKPDGKPRTIALEPISAARSGALLTLACIQRTSHYVAARQQSRARGRSKSDEEEAVRKQEGELPLLQMMTRILPSVACHGVFRDYFIVRTYALHSFAMLLSYSGRLEETPLDEVEMQLCRKSVELIEGNFVAAWTAASNDMDRGQEGEKMASEVAFLAVLLRLMTLVVPFLGRLSLESPGLPHRFSLMVTLILEIHRAHPVVYVEAMAFFEVLTAHRHLLPTSSTLVNYDENPIFSCIPFLQGPKLRPTLFTDEIKERMTFFSSTSLRVAVHTAKILTLSGIRVSNLSDMKTVSFFVAALEVACASRYFFGSTLLRSLAAPSERERAFSESLQLEKEIIGSVSHMLLLEHSFCKEADLCLRWVLFARAILSGASKPREDGEPADSSSIYSREGVVRAASVRAAEDASLVFDNSSVPRWQVKTLAAQLAAGSLDGLLLISRESGVQFKDDPNFEFQLANKECTILCREAQQAQGAMPPSRLVFHLEEILSSACISCGATLDHAELRMLQGSSALFLARVIATFGRVRDHEEPEKSILDQYCTQIFSSVKHGLASPEESDSENSVGLFAAGCVALEAVVETGLAADQTVLKRLIRPIIPPDDQIPFFELSGGSPLFSTKSDDHNAHMDSSISGLVTICRATTTAKLFSGFSDDRTRSMLSIVEADLIKDGTAFAAHAAAIAIDGARLLFGAKLSLAGLPLVDKERRRIPKLTSGLLFKDIGDVSDIVKGWLVSAWSICAGYAVRPLLAAVSADEANDDHKAACFVWVKTIVPLLFSGIHDAEEAIVSGMDENAVVWVSGLDPSSIIVDCLRGLQTVASCCPEGMFESNWNKRMDTLLGRLRLLVILPALAKRNHGEIEVCAESQPNAAVVSQVCILLNKLATSPCGKLRKDSGLLMTLLTPLDMLQREEFDFKQPHAQEIVSTCLSAIGELISQGNAQDEIVRAMLQLVLKAILGRRVPKSVEEDAEQLLCHCLRHSAIDMTEQYRIASSLAEDKNWEAWGAIASVENGAGILASLDTVGRCLRNSTDWESQLKAVAVIGSLAQRASIPSPLVGCIMQSIGADIMAVLYEYGTLKVPQEAQLHRIKMCAESLKILLIGFQQLSCEGTDDEATAYLLVLFETFLFILRFNGLPNHPSPQQGGDESLGRLSAQAILKIARTTPVAFKSCLSQLSDHDRALLEFSVRGEMTGYAVQQEAPSKKKLNLKNFKN